MSRKFGDFDNSSNSCNQSTIPILENYDLPLKNRIINHIAYQTEIVLKSQQKYEPELTADERINIATEILDNKPSQFLYRFGQHLQREHLQYFNMLPKDPELKFYLQETQKLLNESTKKLKIRNRRFGALRKMESGGSSYFSEEEMRNRDPLLYEELISRNLTEKERSDRIQANAPPPIQNFSDLLFEQIEKERVRERQRWQESQDDECYEEEEEEEEDEEEEEEFEERPPLDEKEKKLLEEEFRSSICSRFVDGKDGDFDYSRVDGADDNDMLEWESRDEEERYFEEESPRTVSEETMDDNEPPFL